MDRYTQLKRFHNNRRLQVYMYSFMYVYPETVPVEVYFPPTKICVENYNNISTQGPIPKHLLGYSYISSEYYELDMSFDETYLK